MWRGVMDGCECCLVALWGRWKDGRGEERKARKKKRDRVAMRCYRV